jgi:hypothetical protein
MRWEPSLRYLVPMQEKANVTNITGLIGLLQLIAGWRLLQGRNNTGRRR